MHTPTIVVGLLMGFTAVGVAEDTHPNTCFDEKTNWTLKVCFDGHSGKLVNGSHRFLRRDTVDVWVCELRRETDYSVTIGEKVIAEPDLSGVLKAAQKVPASGAAPNCKQLAIIVGDAWTARTDTLTLQTKEAGDKTFKSLGDPQQLTMGQPVFALSLGFSGTPLGKKSFQTLGAISGSSGSTIGLQENSANRIQPMGFVSASLYEMSYKCCSFHLTAGFTLTNNKISTNPEYLFGPSISFAREQLFITAGAYGGYQGALQSPYTLGGPAPSGSIPTLSQFHWKPGFSISWRVTSFGSSNNKSTTKTP